MSLALNRREFLGATAAAAAAPAASKPNIVFILGDDLGWGELGCYGQTKIATPHTDRLAAEGIRFTRAYAGAAVCAPSRCCLMTGYHTGHARVRGNRRGWLLEQDVTAAQLLKKAGYRTGIFGKWGIGPAGTPGIPNRKGFDTWLGYLDQLHAHSYFPEHLWENEHEVFLAGNMGRSRKQYSHDVFTRAALRFIETNKDQPFFLYGAFTLPHLNNALGRDTGNGFEVPNDAPYSARDWPRQEKNFASMIHRLDDTVGQILAKLKQLGLDNNTIVMLASDNGPDSISGHKTEFFNSKGSLRGEKGQFYEGGIRAPLLARWPGRIQPGATSDHICALWDFLPTAAGLAGFAPPPKLDGISFLPALLGQKQPEHEYLYWETPDATAPSAARMGEWKAFRKSEKASIELYNLDRDPDEKTNLAAKNPAVAARLAEIMRAAHTPYSTQAMRNQLDI